VETRPKKTNTAPILVSSGASEYFCTAVLEEVLRTVLRKESSHGLILKLNAKLLEIPAEVVGKRNYFESQVLSMERCQLLFLYNAKLSLYLKKRTVRIKINNILNIYN